jgi:hypothetical protein
MAAPRDVGVAERNALRIAEIKLREIAVQVLLAAVLIDALHAVLKNQADALPAET